MRRFALSLIAAVLLAACESAPKTKTPGMDTLVATTPEPALQIHAVQIRGRATYPEQARPPPGATLDVQLIDDRVADAAPERAEPQATVAHQTFGNLHGPAYDFVLALEGVPMQPGMRYSMRATLRDMRGRLVFMTPARVPVPVGAAVDLRLLRPTQVLH